MTSFTPHDSILNAGRSHLSERERQVTGKTFLATSSLRSIVILGAEDVQQAIFKLKAKFIRMGVIATQTSDNEVTVNQERFTIELVEAIG